MRCQRARLREKENLFRWRAQFEENPSRFAGARAHVRVLMATKTVQSRDAQYNTKAPAKRSQHADATCRNIAGCNMLRAFGHRVAMCCDMLGVVGSGLKMVKFEPTTPNTSQHVATGWPNARNMLRPTVLRYVALACFDRLAGA